jgi:predicted AAA+ superfamily ATPase
VGTHLVNHALAEDFRLHYWREGEKEVDFVLEHKGSLIGLEVKSSYPNANKMSGMSEFAKQFNPQKMLLVGASGIPVADFLKINPIELFDN